MSITRLFCALYVENEMFWKNHMSDFSQLAVVLNLQIIFLITLYESNLTNHIHSTPLLFYSVENIDHNN